jgi:hypothetical protein
MVKIVRLPVPLDADENARANAERTLRLFDWATTVLRDLGPAKAVAQATSIESYAASCSMLRMPMSAWRFATHCIRQLAIARNISAGSVKER